MGVLWNHPEVLDDDLRDGAARLQPSGEGVQLLSVGKVAFPQQVHDLIESRVRGEVFDRIAAVNELAGNAVDRGDRGWGGDDVLEGAGRGRWLRFWLLRLVDGG